MVCEEQSNVQIVRYVKDVGWKTVGLEKKKPLQASEAELIVMRLRKIQAFAAELELPPLGPEALSGWVVCSTSIEGRDVEGLLEERPVPTEFQQKRGVLSPRVAEGGEATTERGSERGITQASPGTDPALGVG